MITLQPCPATTTAPPALAPEGQWPRVKARLRAALGEDIFSSWFARMECDGVAGGTVRLSVPTRFLKSWISSHYHDCVLACWREEGADVHRLNLYVRTGLMRRPVEPPRTRADGPRQEAPHPDGPTAPHQPERRHFGGSPLDPRLCYATFAVGPSNRIAHAAAKEMAATPQGEPVLFNPLYVHAEVGRGKTHLLQATAAAAGGAGLNALYLTAEKFVFGFVGALTTQTEHDFRLLLKQADMLLIDDIGFLQGRSSLREFAFIVDAVIGSGRPVVVASDRPPLDLDNLDDRLRSRLAGGLVVEMGPLGEELRRDILSARVATARLHHPGFDVPADVLAHIAKSVTHNGRDLEGAVNRLLALSKISGQPITLELAEREIRDLVRPQETRRIRIEDIQRVVARRYHVSRRDLLSERRSANVVRPRQIAMYLAKTMTLRSLPEIGRRFGGRDHTTVLHAVRKIEGLVGTDGALAEEISHLRKEMDS